MLLPFYEEVVLDDDRKVAVITIQAGVTKPYVLRLNNREDIYIRVGATSRLVTREQQARLFASGALLRPSPYSAPSVRTSAASASATTSSNT